MFISYTHDSPEHVKRVVAFANQLCVEGIDCHLDKYEYPHPPEGWARWSLNQIEEAGFVLVVCTEGYRNRIKGKGGLGGIWEGEIITEHIYAASRNAKFIPVVFREDDKIHIPLFLSGANIYDVSNKDHYELLYRHLTNQPPIVKPPVGRRRSLPSDNHPRHLFSQGHVAGVLGSKNKSDVLSKRLDRRGQDSAFRTAAQAHHDAKLPCPLVCVIHGDDGECHVSFLTRIRERLMPEMFQRFAPGRDEEPVIPQYLMTMSLAELTEGRYEAHLWKGLKDAVGISRFAGDEDARNLVTEKKSCVLIYVDLETKDWDGLGLEMPGLERLGWFFKFWGGEAWQGLPEDFILLVCLCCTYKEKPVQGEWKSASVNDDMRAYIQGLKPGAREGIYLAPIDELMAIEHADVKYLSYDPEVARSYRFADYKIEELYKQKDYCVPGGRIKMSLLLFLLDQINEIKETA